MGVRKLKDGLLIGDKKTKFIENQLHIDDKTFSITQGLIELLLKKFPEKNKITTSDSNKFKNIVLLTNAYKNEFIFMMQKIKSKIQIRKLKNILFNIWVFKVINYLNICYITIIE